MSEQELGHPRCQAQCPQLWVLAEWWPLTTHRLQGEAEQAGRQGLWECSRWQSCGVAGMCRHTAQASPCFGFAENREKGLLFLHCAAVHGE